MEYCTRFIVSPRYGQLIFVRNRIHVQWEGYSLIKAELEIFNDESADKNKEDSIEI